MGGGEKKNHFNTVKMAMEMVQKEQVEGKEELLLQPLLWQSHPLAAGFGRLWREAEDSVFQENQEGSGSQFGTRAAPCSSSRNWILDGHSPAGKFQSFQPPYAPGSGSSQHLVPKRSLKCS